MADDDDNKSRDDKKAEPMDYRDPRVDPQADPHAAAKHHRLMVEAERALVPAARNVAELLLKTVEHGPLPAGVAPNDVNEKLQALDQALYQVHMLVDPTEERMPFVRIPEPDQAGGAPEPLPSQTNQPPMPPWPPHYHGEGPSGPDMRVAGRPDVTAQRPESVPGHDKPVPEPPLSTPVEKPHTGASTVDDKPKVGPRQKK